MKKLTKKEIKTEFDRIMSNIHDNDLDAFETVFQAGIDFAYKQSQENKVYKIFDELGFPIDTKKLLELISNDCEDNDGIYDELCDMRNIKFTKVSFNHANSSNREMTIEFSASENRGGKYEKNTIKIDSMGRVNVNIYDTPWEGGGVGTEITKILMKHVAKLKYL
jgi:hypothetical protein